MSDNNLLPKEHRVPETDKPERVESQSDRTTEETSTSKMSRHFNWQDFTQKQKIIAAAVSGFVVIFIAAGVYGAMQKPAEEDFIIVEKKDFGELPESEEGVIVPTSGLSGRTCAEPNRRAIGVMLAADPINRPVSGFAQADMVWELPVLVSNVTRLLAVYQCGQPTEIGSVRSVRHDYLFLAQGVDAIVGHWGGSYHALNRINVGEFQTLNALSNPFNAFYRKNSIPRPYNGFTDYERLWNALNKLGYRTTTEFDGYNFKDDVVETDRLQGGRLAIAWPGQYRVHYEYNKETNRYDRYWAGVKQVDGVDGVAVAPSAVVIMRAANGAAPGPGGYNDVAIEGDGAIAVYQDGKEIKGTWKKNPSNKKDPVHFLDENGDPIVFTAGQVWVMAVAPSISVTWTPQETASE